MRELLLLVVMCHSVPTLASTSNSADLNRNRQGITKLSAGIQAGLSMVDMVDFRSGYRIKGETPGFRPAPMIGYSFGVHAKRTFFEPGVRISLSSALYNESDLHEEVSHLGEWITFGKIMGDLGTGLRFESPLDLMVRAAVLGDFSLAVQTYSNTRDVFTSFGVGGDLGLQASIPIGRRTRIPLRLGYQKIFNTPAKRLLPIWSAYWFDHERNRHRTLSSRSIYVITGVIIDVWKRKGN